MPFEEAVADQPTTETAEATESTELAQESSAEATTEETQQGETQADGTGADADWLPDEQLKVFPDEQYERYAEKRYPDLVALLKDEQTPEPTRKAVRQILHDKINSDIEIRRAKEAGEEVEEEQTEEVEEVADQPQARDPQQWEKAINTFVDGVTDPDTAVKFMGALETAGAIKDPRQRAIETTKALTRGVVNVFPDLINAYLFGAQGKPGVLDQYIESRYEGLGETVRETQYSRAWNNLIGSDPAFKALPAYDPRPDSKWTEAIAKVADLVPGFENFSLAGASPLKNFQAKARIAAKLLSNGVNANSLAVAQKAVETGKQQQKESERNKNLGKLGAGQSKGQIAKPTGDDSLKASLAAHRAQENPFAGIQIPK